MSLMQMFIELLRPIIRILLGQDTGKHSGRYLPYRLAQKKRGGLYHLLMAPRC